MSVTVGSNNNIFDILFPIFILVILSFCFIKIIGYNNNHECQDKFIPQNMLLSYLCDHGAEGKMTVPPEPAGMMCHCIAPMRTSTSFNDAN